MAGRVALKQDKFDEALAAALIVVVGPDDTRDLRAKIAAYPIGAACCGAIGTLYVVAVQGPVSIRFYDPGSVASLIFPIGFYIDRLSAIMMTLIAGVSTQLASTPPATIVPAMRGPMT